MEVATQTTHHTKDDSQMPGQTFYYTDHCPHCGHWNDRAFRYAQLSNDGVACENCHVNLLGASERFAMIESVKKDRERKRTEQPAAQLMMPLPLVVLVQLSTRPDAPNLSTPDARFG